ncbi:MAG: glycine cleavage system protein GcvH [Phycisphaerae bacterium]|nr:glycine cleavage system protein GcvH [Phycisphaerae bacterium]
MAVPSDCRFTQTHEWLKVDGNTVTIGITQFAADELTDITFVEMPEVGTMIELGQSVGEIESVKATSELYAAVSGKVVEINARLADAPELVNSDPFGDGWMLKVECSDLAPLEKLMDAAAYEKMIAE